MNNWTTMQNIGDPFPYEMLKINNVDSHYIIVEETFHGCHVRYIVDNVVKHNEYLHRMKADKAKEYIVNLVDEMTTEDSKYYEDVKQLVKDEFCENEKEVNEEVEENSVSEE